MMRLRKAESGSIPVPAWQLYYSGKTAAGALRCRACASAIRCGRSHQSSGGGRTRAALERSAEMQRAAGLINPRVYHSADSNKSEIVVVFDTEDTKKAKDFAASADLKGAMIKAGVLDTPTIYFLEAID